MDALIVHLETDPGQDVNWVRIPPKGSVSLHSGSLEEIGPLPSSCQLIVIVPGHNVLMTTVNIPGKDTIARQAVPYALEDQLTEDVKMLHFVVGRKSPDNERKVLIVSKERMQEWLVLLRDVGLQPSVMIPDYLALPSYPGKISVLTHGEFTLVRLGEALGFTSDSKNFEDFIPAEFSSETTERIILGAEDLENYKDFLQGDNEQSQGKRLFMALAAQHVIRQKKFDLNLLQEIYQQSSEVKGFFRYWSVPLFLVSLLLVVQCGITVYSNSLLDQQVGGLEKSIEDIFKQTWPAAKIVNPRVQMDQKLQKLLGKKKDDEMFFTLLKAVDSLLSEFPSAKVEKLIYEDFALTIDAKLKDKKLISSLKQKVDGQSDFVINKEQYLPDGGTILTLSARKK